MSGDPVLVEVIDRTLVVTLNRPQARNAIDPALGEALAAALARLDAEPGFRAAVIAGAGGSFCAGMDLRAFAGATPTEAAATLDPLVRRTPRRPVIAAVEGFALGGGLELALACDLIVAASDARLGLPEVRLSLVPSGGGLLRLAAKLPAGAAMEMALTGEPLEAPRLQELGLIARLSPPGGALESALELAARIAANGPLAVAASKALVRAAAEEGEVAQRLWSSQAEICAEVNASADAREGMRAFLEQRKPGFGAG